MADHFENLLESDCDDFDDYYDLGKYRYIQSWVWVWQNDQCE